MSALPSPDPVSPYILLGMTATTGIVDAVSLLALGHVFTANMTGNVVFLGFALAGAQGFSIPRSSTALIAFLLGAAAGGRMATRMTSRPLHYWTCGAFCIDGFLLIGAGLASLALRSSPAVEDYIPLLGVIGLTALAMGFRNATTRKLGVPDLTTTVLTLTITGLAADSSLAGGTNPRWRRRVASVLLMFGGAAVGGVILKRSVAAALCLCGIASVACALAAFERFPHPRGGDSRSVPPAPESSRT
jgi:uncharacterized membrane protein YoaK (UPF0700 family)